MCRKSMKYFIYFISMHYTSSFLASATNLSSRSLEIMIVFFEDFLDFLKKKKKHCNSENIDDSMKSDLHQNI